MIFSILQSVYINDDPLFLELCFQSILSNTLLPDSIILIKDGVLSDDLDLVISEWQKKLPLKVFSYDQNQGLAYALNFGLQKIDTDIVVRMDSDDICLPDRFEKQIAFMKTHPEVVLASSYVEEFNYDENDGIYIRKVPISHKDIQIFLKKRNAFNHMSVVFRKHAIISAGGYQKVPYFEDYDLWIRVVQKGYRTENMADCLVKARIGNDMIGRRRGLNYAKHELFFLLRQYESRFINIFELVQLIIFRLPLRLLPKPLLKIVYNFLRR